MNEGLKRKVKLKFLCSDRPIPVLLNAVPLAFLAFSVFKAFVSIIKPKRTKLKKDFDFEKC